MDKIFFFDRDGVINESAAKHNYIKTWDEFKFMPGIFDVMRYINNNGFGIIIITNQRGIGRGLMSNNNVLEIHNQMLKIFRKENIQISDIFICPHDLNEKCKCRKPKPGLLIEALKKYPIDVSKSYMIGDSESDLEAANAVNVKPILLQKERIDSIRFPYLWIKELRDIYKLVIN